MAKIVSLLVLFFFIRIGLQAKTIAFEFLGHPIQLEIDPNFIQPVSHSLNDEMIADFHHSLNESNYHDLITSLLTLKETYQLNDWLYYQLLRKTAQQISPKSENYYRYTLYKWFLLGKSGYDATLSLSNQQLLFYVLSDDNIYGIPYFIKEQKQFICINYHDYEGIDLKEQVLTETVVKIPEGKRPFSYIITQMPSLKADDYEEKELQFNYKDKNYCFKVKLNPEIQSLFQNYPVVDFQTYFNIPLSEETYRSLIPALKKNVAELNQVEGVDYLMHFTRNSFSFETDQLNFGKEKRLSPEQTLIYAQSDCDDRAALFFYLVREIYNLPMIVLLYPTHVNIAVQFDNPIGKCIQHNGKSYSICDPTPQLKDLAIGEVPQKLKHKKFEVVYEYMPITHVSSRK